MMPSERKRHWGPGREGTVEVDTYGQRGPGSPIHRFFAQLATGGLSLIQVTPDTHGELETFLKRRSRPNWRLLTLVTTGGFEPPGRGESQKGDVG
jgi:hypothetical protein